MCAGNSTSFINYEYIDENVFAPIVYYKLKATDFDGNFGHSKTIVLHNNNQISTLQINSIIPQPIENEAIINITSIKEQSAKLQLFDLKGNQLINKTVEISQGNNNINLSVSTLQSGIYILKLISENLILSEKVLVD